MKYSFTPVFIAAILIGVAAAEDSADEKSPEYALVATAAKKIKAELTVEVKGPRLKADEWTVFVARAPELAGQTEVRTTLLPKSRSARELSELARPVLVDRRPVAGQSLSKRQELTVRIEYRANLLTRRLERREPGASDRPPVVAALDPRERRLALASGHQFDFETEAFQTWLDTHKLQRGSKENDVDFARRVFQEIKHTIKWVEAAKPDRLASHVAEAGKTDDGGVAILYVSALRARGIPARVLTGRKVTPTDDEPGKSRSDEPRIKTEFYAEGVGWVPVDIASGTFRDESSEGLVFFGSDPGDFLTVHLDNDFEFDTYFGRKTEERVPQIAFYVIGSGTLDDLTSRTILKVQTEPLDLEKALPRKPAPTARKAQPTR